MFICLLSYLTGVGVRRKFTVITCGDYYYYCGCFEFDTILWFFLILFIYQRCVKFFIIGMNIIFHGRFWT